MVDLCYLQFRALVWKNWIVLSRNWATSILRCIILPVAYGFFLAYAQAFFHRLNNFGMGSPEPIRSLQKQFDGKTIFYWADGTDGTGNPTPSQIMSQVTSGFTPAQLRSVKQLEKPTDIPLHCPQNFDGVSPCFFGVGFSNGIRNDIAPFFTENVANYTIYADNHLSFVDPRHHTSDFEKRILPLQWSIDKAIIELRTGIAQKTPLEWAYTILTNEDQKTGIRLSYVRGIREIICLAFLLTFVGISYQIPGAVANERDLLITAHMKAMGLLDSARFLSWYISISLTYLPSWIIVALVWKFVIFTNTSAFLMIALHVLLGLVLGGWSFIVSAPFSGSAQLAAILSTLLAVLLSIVGLLVNISATWALFGISIMFPPTFYIFALRAICGYENNRSLLNVLQGDPDTGIIILPLICAGVVNIFLWPYVALLLEAYLHDAQAPKWNTRLHAFWRKEQPSVHEKTETMSTLIPDNTAISIRDLTKIYQASKFNSGHDVTAVMNLSIDVPKSGIFVLLGSNGAGKSTTLSIVAGLSSRTGGSIAFEGGHSKPPRGVLGIVPQKNVFFPELTCMQNLQVWKAVKWSQLSPADEDLEQLLRDCNLEKKAYSNAGSLSGGQKRKLQLAIGLLGGSKIVLVDECTSGVDPLSRRSLWKTLTGVRKDRTIVFTTHFLDEADLLADHVSILAPPGRVVASGTPVSLKQQFGKGYTVQVCRTGNLKGTSYLASEDDLLYAIRRILPQADVSVASSSVTCYHLKTRDNRSINQVLVLLDSQKSSGRIASYDLVGTTMEDVFLELMKEKEKVIDNQRKASYGSFETRVDDLEFLDKLSTDLPIGRPVSVLTQAMTIFHKRLMIFRRSWLAILLGIVVAIAASCAPLVFINDHQQVCTPQLRDNPIGVPLYLPFSPFARSNLPEEGPLPSIYVSPPEALSTLGGTTDRLNTTSFQDNTTFVDAVSRNYRELTVGGVSVNGSTGESLIAWEAGPPGLRGLTMLNLASNILFNEALDLSRQEEDTRSLIQASYATFTQIAASTLVYLKFTFFFGGIMAVYPAIAAIYVSRERCSSIQAMQFSNGMSSPAGLWLGHLMFDIIPFSVLSSIIITIFSVASHQFNGLEFMWCVLFLYGVSSTLFAYCVSLLAPSPLAAFAIVAGYQFITYVLYITSYMAVFTFAPITSFDHFSTIIHFFISLISPVASLIRAVLVSVNLFSLACDGTSLADTTSFLSIKKFGGPMLYLVLYAFVLFAVLILAGPGSRREYIQKAIVSPKEPVSFKEDAAGDVVLSASSDLLRVVDLSKSFKGNKVADGINISVAKGSIFALLGPNGAGKTTTFNIIRGDIRADAGDVFIESHSILLRPRLARSALGVCPQFTAIDSQLTVNQHLYIYARLKGLSKGEEVERSVQMVLEATSLSHYAERLARQLSGGNQRKLALAIALLGNPSVLLIDEFSSGVDPKMKREMWETLRKVSVGKAIVITTHSMEEASALATCVGILSKRILAMGTIEALSARYSNYEVHFSCRDRDDIVKARSLMSHIPGSWMVEDLATRFEVPVDPSPGSGFSLAKLFETLCKHGDFTEYTVEKTSLESIFLKVMREEGLDGERARRIDVVDGIPWWEKMQSLC